MTKGFFFNQVLFINTSLQRGLLPDKKKGLNERLQNRFRNKIITEGGRLGIYRLKVLHFFMSRLSRSPGSFLE